MLCIITEIIAASFAGVEFPYIPDTNGVPVPLVCDASSSFLTQPLDISKVCPLKGRIDLMQSHHKMSQSQVHVMQAAILNGKNSTGKNWSFVCFSQSAQGSA